MLFDYLKPAQGPVVEGLEDVEKIYALEQAEYLPLRMLPAMNGNSCIYRLELTSEQRQMVAEGADAMSFEAKLDAYRSAVLRADWTAASKNGVVL